MLTIVAHQIQTAHDRQARSLRFRSDGTSDEETARGLAAEQHLFCRLSSFSQELITNQADVFRRFSRKAITARRRLARWKPRKYSHQGLAGSIHRDRRRPRCNDGQAVSRLTGCWPRTPAPALDSMIFEDGTPPRPRRRRGSECCAAIVPSRRASTVLAQVGRRSRAAQAHSPLRRRLAVCPFFTASRSLGAADSPSCVTACEQVRAGRAT